MLHFKFSKIRMMLNYFHYFFKNNIFYVWKFQYKYTSDITTPFVKIVPYINTLSCSFPCTSTFFTDCEYGISPYSIHVTPMIHKLITDGCLLPCPSTCLCADQDIRSLRFPNMPKSYILLKKCSWKTSGAFKKEGLWTGILPTGYIYKGRFSNSLYTSRRILANNPL